MYYIKNEIIKSKEFEFNEDDILHTVLVEPKQITDEYIISIMDKELNEEYNNADETTKKLILKLYRKGFRPINDEVQYFCEKMEIYKLKKLREKIKEKIP